MSFKAVDQLYKDVAVQASINPTYTVQQAVSEAYNVNLRVAKEEHEGNPIISALRPATEDSSRAELHVLLGQLRAALEDEQAKNRKPRQPMV